MYVAFMSNDSTRATLLRESHRLIDEAADSVVDRIARIAAGQGGAEARTLTYPPTDGVSEEHLLTQAEAEAISRFGQSESAQRGLRKLIRDAASASWFHFFCLLDGVADPESPASDEMWFGAEIVTPREEDRAMLHDEFYEHYWDWLEARSK